MSEVCQWLTDKIEVKQEGLRSRGDHGDQSGLVNDHHRVTGPADVVSNLKRHADPSSVAAVLYESSIITQRNHSPTLG